MGNDQRDVPVTPLLLYLASSSPRRRELVKLLGDNKIVIRAADIDETIRTGEVAEIVVQKLALKKAEAVAERLSDEEPHGIVIGADTIVVLHGEILGKPIDSTDAITMLTKLSGKTHTVYTGVALVDTAAGKTTSFFEMTDVTFRSLGLDEIESYVAGGSPMDKAGAYGIQDDHGAVFVSRIEGDYYNVVGLPLSSLYVRLKEFIAGT